MLCLLDKGTLIIELATLISRELHLARDRLLSLHRKRDHVLSHARYLGAADILQRLGCSGGAGFAASSSHGIGIPVRGEPQPTPGHTARGHGRARTAACRAGLEGSAAAAPARPATRAQAAAERAAAERAAVQGDAGAPRCTASGAPAGGAGRARYHHAHGAGGAARGRASSARCVAARPSGGERPRR